MKPMVRPLLACTLSLIGTPALATHFMTVIDPATGQPHLLVSAGIVSAAGGTGQNNTPPLILPTQTLTLQPSSQAAPPGIQVIDPSAFVSTASPEIIQSLIRNKSAIDQENRDLTNSLRNASQPGLGQSGQPDTDRLASNLDNVLINALRQASQNPAGTPSTPASAPPAPGNASQPGANAPLKANALLGAAQAAQQRRELANRLSGSKGASQANNLRPDAPADNGVVAGVLMQQIANNVQEQTRPLQQALNNTLNTPAQPPSSELEAVRQNAQDALNDLTQAATNMAIQAALQAPTRPLPGIDLPTIDLPAGVDPEMERQRQQQKQQAEERKQQQMQQKEEKKQQVTNNNQQVIAQIQQSMQQLQQQNQQAQQEKQQQATEKYLQQLTQEQRERWQNEMQAERDSSPNSRAESKKPSSPAPGSISMAESLRQSLDQLQEQNSQQAKRPAGGEPPADNNKPSNTEKQQTGPLATGPTVLSSAAIQAAKAGQAEQRKQQQMMQEQQRQQKMEEAQQNVLDQIQQAMSQLQQQNQQAQQEKSDQAREQFLQRLTPEQRESLAQQREGAGQGKRPASNEPANGGNAPATDSDVLRDAMARLQAMLGQLDQFIGKQPGSDGAGDENRQTLTQHLAQLNALYAGLISQLGNTSAPTQNLTPNLSQLASLTQELANRTQEQSQESLRQLDEALKQAVEKVAATKPLINEYDPWGAYIFVANREYTTNLHDVERYGNVVAHYEGKVTGTVDNNVVNGTLNMQFDLTPGSDDITGSMDFGSHGTLRMSVYQGIGDQASFSGGLYRIDDNPVFGGNIEGGFEGNLFGTNADQVGGNWNVTVYKEGMSSVDGGGVFAGAKVSPPTPSY